MPQHTSRPPVIASPLVQELFDEEDGGGGASAFVVTAAADEVWTVDDGAGAPIAADDGSYKLWWEASLGPFVLITLGDTQATIQAAFDVSLGTGVATVVGNWADFTLTLHAPRGLAVGNTLFVSDGGLSLLGNNAPITLTKTSPGHPRAAEFTGQLTVTANTGEIGETALSITKYDGTPAISHLDDDGGFVLGHITGSEDGSLDIDNQGSSPGGSILRLASGGSTAFQVFAPGGGFGTIVSAHEPTDVPLLVYGWIGQTADLLQLRDGDTDDVLFAIGADGEVGFFGATPAAQAAHPANITDVIALLTAYGLCAP